ncbi:MAG: hypothetical protein PHU62_00035 [Bacteroidales bacterium]|jgi:opacity protein-like surface antigen|nr:hypothetical protein [Bacteroidales bacterium]MDD3152341.1 hypothetical protein [Bacteroidales bacterium]MDD3913044.1 hypothetical protein [Bacteroidales bacterium]MDD4632959.1 hypothetical protein [Bacteroidales bacterium]
MKIKHNKTILLLVMFFGLCMSSAFAQDEVRVGQEGKIVVIGYNLSADASSVKLFVSFDEGRTWRGPLKQVSGDVSKVKAGSNKQIRWDPIAEFGSLKGSVIFKVEKKIKRQYNKETFVTLNAAYSVAPQLSYGFTIGQVKRHGWYISAMTGTGFHTKGNYNCDTDGNVDGVMVFYSGKTSTTRLSLTAGGVIRLAQPLFLYVGAGYGYRGLFWETENGQWIKNTGFSYSGIEAEAGVMGNIKDFVITAGVKTINFQYMEAKIGVGYKF